MPKKKATKKATGAVTPAEASVVTVGKKKCKPFIIEVMVFSPESGYKIEVLIERACTPENDSIWKVVFDLYKEKANGNGFDQLVHVSYRGKTQEENQKIIKTLDGVNDAQADVLIDEVFPASKNFAANPTDENKQKVANAGRNFVLEADV